MCQFQILVVRLLLDRVVQGVEGKRSCVGYPGDPSARRARLLWLINPDAQSFLAILFPLAWLRRKWTSLWLFLPVVGLTLFYMAFWYFEEYYPARYLFSAVPYLLILSGISVAALCVELQANLQAEFGHIKDHLGHIL